MLDCESRGNRADFFGPQSLPYEVHPRTRRRPIIAREESREPTRNFFWRSARGALQSGDIFPTRRRNQRDRRCPTTGPLRSGFTCSSRATRPPPRNCGSVTTVASSPLLRRSSARCCSAADAEDAALHAFDAFLRAAEKGRFPRLDDRDDLWHILGAITARKAADQVVREGRGKRGGGKVRGDSVLEGPTATDSAEGWERIRGTDPTPESAAETAEELQRLLALLPDEEARSIAVGKMQGYTNEEIAGQLGRSIPTVERRLRIIRKAWEKEVNPEGGGDALHRAVMGAAADCGLHG